MSFVKVNANNSVTTNYDFRKLRQDFPNISFPSDAFSDLAMLAFYNVFPVIDNVPTFNPAIEIPSKTTVVKIGNDYVQQYAVVPLPSYLDGGSRDPTSAEIAANLRVAYDYYFWKVQEKVKAVAANNMFLEVKRDAEGRFSKVGTMEKAAKYGQLATGAFKARANQLMKWESDVWTYLQTRWMAIDPSGNFTGGGVTPPTWSQLEADINTTYPVP